ncbi:MAG: hypothetical protein K6B52_09515 [Clostridiales bacterium]|nr:hypothetical protein [Clostridiales bacterium]
MDTITASISENRVLTFAPFTGYTGESGAARFAVSLGPMAAGFDSYTLRFRTGGMDEIFSSNIIEDENSDPAYVSHGVIYCPVGDELTKTGVLFVQVAGYALDDNLQTVVCASSVAKLTFGESIGEGGEKSIFSSTDEKVIASLTAGLSRANRRLDELEDSQRAERFVTCVIKARKITIDCDGSRVTACKNEEQLRQSATVAAGRFDSDETEKIVLICPPAGDDETAMCVISEGENGVSTQYLTYEEVTQL